MNERNELEFSKQFTSHSDAFRWFAKQLEENPANASKGDHVDLNLLGVRNPMLEQMKYIRSKLSGSDHMPDRILLEESDQQKMGPQQEMIILVAGVISPGLPAIWRESLSQTLLPEMFVSSQLNSSTGIFEYHITFASKEVVIPFLDPRVVIKDEKGERTMSIVEFTSFVDTFAEVQTEMGNLPRIQLIIGPQRSLAIPELELRPLASFSPSKNDKQVLYDPGRFSFYQISSSQPL